MVEIDQWFTSQTDEVITADTIFYLCLDNTGAQSTLARAYV